MIRLSSWFVGTIAAFMIALSAGATGDRHVGRPSNVKPDASYAPSPDSVARAILQSSLAAYGEEARLQSIDDVTADFVAELRLLGQSRAPEPPLDVEPARTRTTLARARNSFMQLTENGYPRGFTLRFRTVLRTDSSFVIDPTRGFQGARVVRLSREATAAQRALMLRELPPYFVMNALRTGKAMRGRSARAMGSRYDVIELDDGAGPVTAYFDAKTHLLQRLTTRSQHALGGEILAETTFEEYRDLHGIRLPTRRVDRRNGEWAQRGDIRWSFDERPADSLFSVPPGYQDATSPAVGSAVRRAGPGVYVVRLPDGSYVLGVEFRDYVVVVEAPVSSATSEAAIGLLSAAIPSKPIRYVAFSHHHTDHAGGLRAYIARGITVVTTPRYEGFVRKLARLEYPLAPDSQSHSLRAPRIETFRGKRTFTDGTQTLELHDIGATSHAVSTVFAYVPSIGLLYDGDATVIPPDVPVQPGNVLNRELLGALGRLGIAATMRTIINMHVGEVTPARLREAVRLSGARQRAE